MPHQQIGFEIWSVEIATEFVTGVQTLGNLETLNLRHCGLEGRRRAPRSVCSAPGAVRLLSWQSLARAALLVLLPACPCLLTRKPKTHPKSSQFRYSLRAAACRPLLSLLLWLEALALHAEDTWNVPRDRDEAGWVFP